MGAPVGDAEDIAQETLLAIHLHRNTWRQTDPLGPWVAAIARYKLIDSLRRRGRRTEVAIDELADALPDCGADQEEDSGGVKWCSWLIGCKAVRERSFARFR